MTDFISRFWSKVDKTCDCWLWTDVPGSAGYGLFYLDGRKVLAHRLAYELVVGEIPEGLELDHRPTCRKICVRPEHLTPATHQQNQENRAGATSLSKTGVRGVSRAAGPRKKCWQAQVNYRGQHFHLGYYATVEEAEAVVIAKRLELYTHNQADRVDA